jgi:hypothetical protein
VSKPLRAAIIVIVGAVVYENGLSGPFIFDDKTAIQENPQIRRLWPLSDVLTPLQDTPVAGRPLVNLSFAINYAIHGLDVTGYRVTNLAFQTIGRISEVFRRSVKRRHPSSPPAQRGSAHVGHADCPSHWANRGARETQAYQEIAHGAHHSSSRERPPAPASSLQPRCLPVPLRARPPRRRTSDRSARSAAAVTVPHGPQALPRAHRDGSRCGR